MSVSVSAFYSSIIAEGKEKKTILPYLPLPVPLIPSPSHPKNPIPYIPEKLLPCLSSLPLPPISKATQQFPRDSHSLHSAGPSLVHITSYIPGGASYVSHGLRCDSYALLAPGQASYVSTLIHLRTHPHIYSTTSLASLIKLSLGQYGHLNRPPLLSLCRLSFATTCPHGIIIGGFVSVVCSLLTGHTKIAWKIILLGNAISTGNSFCVVHSVLFSFTIEASFRRVGKAMAPAVTER